MAGNKILIVTAVEQEKKAILNGLGGSSRFDVMTGGVGAVEAAVSTASALHSDSYEAVISTGIAGGFEQPVIPGSLIIASTIISADAGSETPETFYTLEDLNLGSSSYQCDAGTVEKLKKGAAAAGLAAASGPVLTMMTATGSKESAQKLRSRFPGALAEAMEGYGAAAAARRKNVPAFELRTISNAVGPRDRENWYIKEALAALEKAGSILQEVF